jgi:hypothetical protein
MTRIGMAMEGHDDGIDGEIMMLVGDHGGNDQNV